MIRISLVEVYKREGNLSFHCVNGPKRANNLTDAFYGRERDKKTSWFSDKKVRDCPSGRSHPV